MRILDDLWLVMHGVIDQMPLQEESMSEKEELKRKRVKYLKDKKLATNLTDKVEE